MSINRVVISGNMTRDIEIRSTAGGTTVGQFGMAVNDRRRNQQTNEWEDYPNFVDVTVFGNRATALQKMVGKGSKVCVEGKLRWSQWERDGQKRTKLEVIGEDVEIMQRRADGQQQAPQTPSQPQYQQWRGNYQPQQYQGGYDDSGVAQQYQQQHQYAQAQMYDEEIPF